jgi:hypothetical protein
MAESENHTLRLLREIRGAIGALDDKIDRNQEELQKRIDSLRQAMLGESVLGLTPPPNSTSALPSNSVLPHSKAEGDLPATAS